jgi:hypothetical protein
MVDLKRSGRKLSWPNLWYYFGIRLERLRRTTKTAKKAGIQAEI